MHIQAFFRPIRHAPLNLADDSDPLSRSDRTLLSIADAGADSHVVIFVPGALDLACALLRQGVSEVTMVRVEDRQPTTKADVAIIPKVRSLHFLGHAIPCARRMLMPLGTVTLHIEHDLIDVMMLHARRLLMLHGFSAPRTWITAGGLVLKAGLPACGKVPCA